MIDARPLHDRNNNVTAIECVYKYLLHPSDERFHGDSRIWSCHLRRKILASSLLLENNTHHYNLHSCMHDKRWCCSEWFVLRKRSQTELTCSTRPQCSPTTYPEVYCTSIKLYCPFSRISDAIHFELNIINALKNSVKIGKNLLSSDYRDQWKCCFSDILKKQMSHFSWKIILNNKSRVCRSIYSFRWPFKFLYKQHRITLLENYFKNYIKVYKMLMY